MEIFLWLGFIVFVIAMLAIDLGLFNKGGHEVSIVEALTWTSVWVLLALGFNVLVFLIYEHHWLGVGTTASLNGRDAALQFFTGYVIEKSLSLDNIFVIAVIFGHFRVPPALQHRVLFYGILGALVMRGLMIGAGASLLHHFSWIMYVFGALLIVTAIKMLTSRPEHIDPSNHFLVRIAKRFFPLSPEFDGEHFFSQYQGRRAMTPLFVVLIVIESTDVLFAVDSIPAIFAVTREPFLVFTSNIFAILGLRTLYFVLAGVLDRFRYLKMSLVFLLAYIGVKMLISHHFPIPPLVSLAIIGGILAVGVIGSLVGGHRDEAALPELETHSAPINTTNWRAVRRWIALVGAAVFLLIGIAYLILPGSALPPIAAGVLLFSTELLWLRKIIDAFRRGGKGD